MLVELLKPGGIELARRWLAALLLVPVEEREEVVNAVEAQIVAEYDLARGEGDDEMVVRYPAVQRDGYIEEVVKRYGVSKPEPTSAARRGGRAAGA